MKFTDLGLIAPILNALTNQGYTEPTPIQRLAIPPALVGRDVLGCAQTGTGKTCAFATPILQRLNAVPPKGQRNIRALILTPTRELALQIQECFEGYGKELPLRSAVIFGGVGQNPQVEKLKRGLDILVATPGRLLDLQGQGLLDLSHVEIFVLDEADRMLDMGFIHDVKRVLKVLPAKKQTLFFSATMPPEVMELVNSLLHDPAKVAVDPVSSPVEVIDQSVYLVDKGNKSKLLASLFKTLDVKNALIFTRTKHGANKVAADMEKAGISAAAIHGNKSQTARQQALSDFKAGKLRALVATDIAARGIDIEELSHVFNYNLPEVPETYVHRIGRTGRAGRGGTAVAFCDFGEKQYLKDIEKLIGKKINLIDGHSFPMEIFEEPKDAKGRPVNADDDEARAAARERRKLRMDAQKQAGGKTTSGQKTGRGNTPTAKPAPAKQTQSAHAPAKASAPAEAPKKKREPRWQKSEGGAKKLDSVLPERTSAWSEEKYSDFRRPSPLDSDRIMDATARLLAPKPRAAAAPAPVRAAAEEPRRDGGNRRRKPEAQPAQKPAAPQQRKAAPAPKAARGTAPAEKSAAPAPRGQNAGKGKRDNFRRSGPRPVELRKSDVKDSTEQDTLMKPYYLEH